MARTCKLVLLFLTKRASERILCELYGMERRKRQWLYVLNLQRKNTDRALRSGRETDLSNLPLEQKQRAFSRPLKQKTFQLQTPFFEVLFPHLTKPLQRVLYIRKTPQRMWQKCRENFILFLRHPLPHRRKVAALPLLRKQIKNHPYKRFIA